MNTEAFQANGTAERDAALILLEQIPGTRVTVGADKAYDTREFVGECRQLNVTPHVAQNVKRRGGSAIDVARRGIAVTRSASENASASRVLRLAQDDRADAQGSRIYCSRAGSGWGSHRARSSLQHFQRPL